ncbi:MAG: DUF4198 domain-containing protein [Deltaproteobacteria bacterium]|nr:DUF4198 domain-containing protein [Deltaproteobacteria bacterium]
MTIKNVLLLSLFFLTGINVNGTASAHHLWVEKSDDSYSIARGVLDERFDSYMPDRVRDFIAIGMDGNAVQKEKIRRSDDPEQARFHITEQVSMVAVTCDWGYRVNTTRGKKLLRRSEAEKEGLRVISSFFSTHYSKVFFEEGSANTKPAGIRLEIVPLKDPLGIHGGDDLPLQVLFDGKPLADVVITGESKEQIPTDNNGIGHMKISKKGKTLLMLGHKVPVRDDPEKDYHLYTTFMVFEVK